MAAQSGIRSMTAQRTRGFTLIEVMITVAILAIIASVALPSYTAYIMRSRVPAALDGLSSYATKMEQSYQDTGNYGTPNCRPTLPTAKDFTFTCAIGDGGQSYVATATGAGTMSGYVYTINQTSTRRTVSHPKGVPATDCWSLKGTSCDT
jgi:type IV pilus assembly protein PilE